MTTNKVSIRIHLAADPTQQAWLTMHVQRRDDQQVRLKAEVAEALAADPVSFLHPVPANQAHIIKTEIMGGIVTAKKHAGVGCTVELVSVGGASGEVRSVSGVPSIAFAVASTLAVLQGLEKEDLRVAPHGGYGWKLDEVAVESVD
ncbi:MAG: hypothetical protein H0W83_09400 [Planctomycetes bacterium]|nr:hypothetical protein [Planctomycetota bacterium]